MKNGSPRDRGSADRYYGRPYDPHYYPYGTGKGVAMGGSGSSGLYDRTTNCRIQGWLG